MPPRIVTVRHCEFCLPGSACRVHRAGVECESCDSTGFEDVRHSDRVCAACDGSGTRKRKPGRPITTGSSATQRIVYRVTAAQRAELDEEARRLGLSSADLAAKARAFPKLGTEVKR